MNLAVAKYLRSAQKQIEQEQWHEAKLNLQQIIELEPHRWDVHFNLGVILSKQQYYDEAIEKFKQAILIKPDYDWSYNNLGELFLKLGCIGDAVQSFIQAITINQNNPQFYYNLGTALLKKGSIDQAVVCFRQAKELNPEDHELQFKLGKAFRNQSLISEAIACFCRAIEIDHNYSFAYISLKYTRLNPTQSNYLIEFYQKVLLDHPLQAEALANLSDLLAAQGNVADAITFSRQAIQSKIIQSNPELAKTDNQFKKRAPDFIIIGVGKSGTTSLYRYLGQHSQVLLPNKKELRFFDQNFNYGYQWYLAQFPAVSDRDDLFTGEASPSYFFLPQVAQRIYDFAPQIKIIVMLRNPIERSISDYYQNKKSDPSCPTLEETINTEIANLEQKSEAELAYGGGILSQSLYYYKLKRWMKIFPRNQFLIINSDRFFANLPDSMMGVFDFINVSNTLNNSYKKYNAGSYPQPKVDIRKQLRNFFTPHNQKLEEYLQMDLDW